MTNPHSKNPRVECRVPEDIFNLVHDKAKREGLTASDVMRDALIHYFYQTTSLQGTDAGFLAARKLANRLAMASVLEGAKHIPEDFDEAMEWCENVIQESKNK